MNEEEKTCRSKYILTVWKQWFKFSPVWLRQQVFWDVALAGRVIFPPKFRRNVRPASSGFWVYSRSHNAEDKGDTFLEKRRERITRTHGAKTQKTWFVFACLLCRLRLKCDGTRTETRFCLSEKRTSPFKWAGASVQSTTGSRGVRISFYGW